MSPTLTDANQSFADQSLADPSDGLAALEGRRSTAETHGIPLAVLAEVTHRCPLQCPYCSNPVELDRGARTARLAQDLLTSLLTPAVASRRDSSAA